MMCLDQSFVTGQNPPILLLFSTIPTYVRTYIDCGHMQKVYDFER